MAERKRRPATYYLDPTLEQERDAEAERERSIVRRPVPKATLDPQLAKDREALIQRESDLAGRSVSEAPISR
jgi:hypothetical protein